MNRIFNLLVLAMLCAAHAGQAQSKTARPADAKQVPHKKLLVPQTYLGSGNFSGGFIPKAQLAQLLRQGITSRDSLGRTYKVAGFELAYSERMLYEDSVGNRLWTNDYMSEYCVGDTLSAGVAASIYKRFKAGDTLFINNVKVIRSSAGSEPVEIAGLGMKCVLEK